MGATGNPTSTDTLVNTPQADQVVNDVTFPATLNVSTSILVIPHDDLQHAVATQLDTIMRKDKNYQGEMILADASHQVKIDQTRAIGGDATSMVLTINATAQAIPAVSQNDIRAMIAGKSVKIAKTLLAQQRGIQHVDIEQSPGFISWIPQWTMHINVHLLPAPLPTTPPKK